MRQAEVITELTTKGQELEAQFTRMLEDLTGTLKASAPAMTDANKVAFVAAVKDLAEATNTLRAAEIRLAGNQRAVSGAGVRAAELDLTVAPVILAAREEMLEWARSLPDSYEDHRDKEGYISFAEGQIRNRTRDLENAPANLERAQASGEEELSTETRNHGGERLFSVPLCLRGEFPFLRRML